MAASHLEDALASLMVIEDRLHSLMVLEDGCSNLDIKDGIRTFRILISILRPLLRFLLQLHILEKEQVQLKHIVDVVQKVSCWTFEHVDDDAPTTRISAELVTSNLEILKSLKEDIIQIATLHPDTFVGSPDVESLIDFIESLFQNLRDISCITCKAPERNIPVTKELAQIKEKLKFLPTFLCLICDVPESKDVVISAQLLVVKISYNLFLCFADDELVASDRMKEDILPDLLRKLNTLLLDLRQVYYNESVSTRVMRLSDDHPNMNEHYALGIVDYLILKLRSDDHPNMNEQYVLGFVDYLILKLRELSKHKASFKVDAVKIQIDILLDELRFFKNSIMHLLLIEEPIEQTESLRISVGALIIDTGLFICFSLEKEGDEDVTMTNYLSFGLPDLLVAVDTFNQQARAVFHKYFPRSWRSNCPSTNEQEFVDFLIKKLQELLDSNNAALIDPLERQIVMVIEEMINLRKCFSEMAELMGNSQMEFLLTRFRDAAYIAECITDSFTVKIDLLWFQMLGLFVVIKDVKVLQDEVKSILNFTCVTHVHNNIAMAPSCASSHANVHPNNNAAMASKVEMQNKVEDADKLVGLKDATMRIIEQLTEGSRQLKILSIVGMPGLGKTTLANSVYKHPSVDNYFNVRGWYCLSKVYQKEALLSSILGQICQETNQYHGSVQNFAQKVYQNLKGRKYLIVLDDIWDIDSWNDLKQIFPDDVNGSRILFTTQMNAVAKKVKSLPYALRLLSNEESCELLCLKLFNQETCPQELSSISKRIASSCKGLPLAVVLVAGILKRIERNKDSWERVAKTLIRSHSIQKNILKIMEVCYNHLPDYLKPCFLYFGTFPKSTTVSVSKMIRLWISEGFVQQPNHGQKSLEQEAESYLNDLIDRSLVTIAIKSSRGGVKACCVHDILQEFCFVKLEKERYVTQKDMRSGFATLYGDFRMHKLDLLCSFSTSMPDICSLLYYDKSDIDMDSRWKEDPSEPVQFSDFAPRGRMCFSADHAFVHLLPVSRNIFSAGTETETSQPRQLNYRSVLKCKNLRVLDLGNVQVQSSADTSDLVNIAKLVCLKYLTVRVRTTEIPSEIGNLQNLETFHLTGAIGRVMLPEVIWKLVRLRHIIMDHSFFSFQHYSQEFFENPFQLDTLKSISTLYMWHGNIEKFMRRLPRVQKLGCIFSNSWQDHYEACNLFKVLEFLRELQSLKMSFHARAPYPFKFSFPSNLKKLAMSNARLPWNEISVIGQLPNLEVLKLTNRAFEGQLWVMREDEFQKLKFLKLDSLDIVKWDAAAEHLPCLEQLVVRSCQQLEEIPCCFGEILTLQLIEMKWCSASAADSVKRILQDQRDLSNDQLKVILVGVQHHFA